MHDINTLWGGLIHLGCISFRYNGSLLCLSFLVAFYIPTKQNLNITAF